MRDQSTSSSAHRRPSAAVILLVPIVVAAVLTLFAWPNARLEPRDLPIGVAGPESATGPIEQKLQGSSNSFEIHRYANEAEAREAIEDRDVYGSFLATPEGPTVLTSSAASPAVAQVLGHAASDVGAPTEDVVAAPRGSALASAVLPMVIAGLLTGVAAALLTTNALGRVGLLLAGSVLAGLASAAIVQSWLDIVRGDWATNAAVLSLTVLSIGAAITGLYAWLGERGVVLGALTMILIGNPFSAASTAPELLPTPVGGLGQLMPPGAGANLLRSTGFFDGAAAGQHVAVLAAWALGGLALVGLAAMRRTRTASSATPVPTT